MNKVYPLVLTILLAFVIGHYFFGPQEVFLRHNCLIQKTGHCVTSQDGITLDLTISPLPIVATEDLKYDLKITGMMADKVIARLLGHDMEMPRDEQVFPMESFLKRDEFQAIRNFPICTEKEMTWRLYLVIQGEKKVVRTTYDLVVLKDAKRTSQIKVNE